MFQIHWVGLTSIEAYNLHVECSANLQIHEIDIALRREFIDPLPKSPVCGVQQ